jgi:hypothetical protein
MNYYQTNMVVMLNRHKVVNGSGFSILNSDLISDFVDQYSIIQITLIALRTSHFALVNALPMQLHNLLS